MQFKVLSVLTICATLAAATATPVRRNDAPPASECNTGDVQCCQSATTSTDASTATLLGLLGIVTGSLTGLVGTNCSPITAIGLGGSSCSAQPVCCSNNSFNGVIALGCTPVNINL